LPYLGPSVLASSIGMNKQLFLELLSGWGLAVPSGFLVEDIDVTNALCPQSLATNSLDQHSQVIQKLVKT